MRFVKSWDVHVRSELCRCLQRSEKAVLCSYGRPYLQGQTWKRREEKRREEGRCGEREERQEGRGREKRREHPKCYAQNAT